MHQDSGRFVNDEDIKKETTTILQNGKFNSPDNQNPELPSLAQDEIIDIKGVYFRVTGIKMNGRLKTRMLNSAQVEEARKSGTLPATSPEKRIAALLGQIFYHGKFFAETQNEVRIEKLMRENGYFCETSEQANALAIKFPEEVLCPTEGGY